MLSRAARCAWTYAAISSGVTSGSRIDSTAAPKRSHIAVTSARQSTCSVVDGAGTGAVVVVASEVVVGSDIMVSGCVVVADGATVVTAAVTTTSGLVGVGRLAASPPPFAHAPRIMPATSTIDLRQRVDDDLIRRGGRVATTAATCAASSARAASAFNTARSFWAYNSVNRSIATPFCVPGRRHG